MSTPYDPPPDRGLSILYQDESLLFVEKPSGLLSVPGRGVEKSDCLITRVQARFGDALIVHRLDMETSGLMVLARGKTVHRSLSVQFERREVEKSYMACVAGMPDQEEGVIDLPIMKDWPNRPLQKVDLDAGKPSVTQWRLVEPITAAFGVAARLSLTPLTGRTHQLRVHLNAIGHPILGDTLYGTPQSQAGAPRLNLHATELALAHPVNGQKMILQSAAPF